VKPLDVSLRNNNKNNVLNFNFFKVTKINNKNKNMFNESYILIRRSNVNLYLVVIIKCTFI